MGMLTPVAELESVEIVGTTVKQASLPDQHVISQLQLAVVEIMLICA